MTEEPKRGIMGRLGGHVMERNKFMDVRITVRDGETGEESSFWLSDAWGYDDGEIYASIPGAGWRFCNGDGVTNVSAILSPDTGTGLSVVKAEALMREKTEDPS